MNQTLHILLIDDSRDDRLLVKRELSREFTDLQVQEILEAKGFEQALAAGNFDLVVTDYQLGWSDGITLLRAIKSHYPDCPVVMFTNSGNEEIAVEAMKSGLDDYIIKAPTRYARVPIAVRLGLERAEIRRRAARFEAEREQLLAQERAARAEAEAANRLKDEFLATLSHELRTPLNALLGWTQLLRLRQLDPENYGRAVETIERNAKSLTRLIEDLLDVSRIITGKLSLSLRPIELIPVVESALNTVRSAAEAKSIALETHFDPTIGAILGDATRLQQVIWNLLSNAVKFTSEKGRVQIQLTQSESSVMLIVSDSGQGIHPEFLPYVFDRFRQADSTITRVQGGLGLGLAIVRYLVELHGGTVQVTSPGVGQGATFTVKLPILATDAPISRLETDRIAINSQILQGIRVLVVDDELDARQLLVVLLEQYGVEVKAASSGQEALAIFLAFQPDVLISDVGMPDQDGYELIEQIRTFPVQQGGNVPAIALTAHARESDRSRAFAAGFQLHIPKPVEPEQLIQAIARLVGRV